MGYKSNINIKLGLQPPPMEDQSLYNTMQGVYNAIHILNAAYGSVSDAINNINVVEGVLAFDAVAGDIVAPWPNMARDINDGGKYLGKMVPGVGVTFRQERYTYSVSDGSGGTSTATGIRWYTYGLPGATFFVKDDTAAGETAKLIRAVGEFGVGDDSPIGSMLLGFGTCQLRGPGSTGTTVPVRINNDGGLYTDRVPGGDEDNKDAPFVVGSIFAPGKAMFTDMGTMLPRPNDHNFDTA